MAQAENPAKHNCEAYAFDAAGELKTPTVGRKKRQKSEPAFCRPAQLPTLHEYPAGQTVRVRLVTNPSGRV